MIKYMKCICNGFDTRLNFTTVYKIEIDENNGYALVYNVKTANKHPLTNLDKFKLELLPIYFKEFLSKEETISLIKENLGITDDDIIEYRYNDKTDITCVKYKHDLIYLKFTDDNSYTNDYDIKIKMVVKIHSNNLARQSEFIIALFEDDINKFCNLIKFMHK